MVDEVRRLIFSDEELLAALSAIMLQRGDCVGHPTPPAMLHSRDAMGEVVTVMHYSGSDSLDDVHFNFNSRELTAAMVNFCIQAGIPLPRRAEKSADIHDGRVALVLALIDLEEIAGGEGAAPAARKRA